MVESPLFAKSFEEFSKGMGGRQPPEVAGMASMMAVQLLFEIKELLNKK